MNQPTTQDIIDAAAEKLARRLDPDRLLNSKEAGELFGCASRTFSESIAVQPDFPAQRRLGRWQNGEIREHLRKISHAN